MANEDQYYNPIIQAMIHTATLQKQGAQQEIEKQKNADEKKLRQDALKQAQTQFDQEHELRQKAADIAERHFGLQSEQFKLQKELDHVKMMADASKFVQGGGDANKIPGIHQILGFPDQEQQQPANFSPAAGSSQIAPRIDINQALFNPEVAGRTMFTEAKAKAQGAAEGNLPSEQALAATHYDFNKKLQDAAHESAMDIKKVDRMMQQEANKYSRDTQLIMNQNDNKTRLAVAGMGGDENSQNLVNSLKMGLATGEIKLNPTNRLHQIAYGQLQDNDWKAVDPVDIKEAKGMQNIEPLLGKLQKLADKLPDNPVGEAITRGTETVKNTFVTSKLRNDINIINSQIMNVARSTEGVTGRVLASALKPELESLASVTSKSNMQDRINNLRDNYVNKFNNVIFAGMSDAQKELVYKKHGLKPVSASGEEKDLAVKRAQYEETRVNPKSGHEVGKKNGKWYDVKTGVEYNGQ